MTTTTIPTTELTDDQLALQQRARLFVERVLLPVELVAESRDGRLPDETVTEIKREAIAARLVNWLPGRSAAAIPSVEAAPIGSEQMKSEFATWLVWGVLAVALLSLGLHLFGGNNLEVGGGGTGVSTQQ